MSRASEDLFDQLHKLTVETLQSEIKKYTDANEAVPPALLAQAIKLLKDNGIDSPERVKNLHDELPVGLPEFGPEDVVTGVPH